MKLTSRPSAGQHKLRAAIEAGLDAWFLLDAVRDASGQLTDFVYADMNAIGAALLGGPLHDMIGRRMVELFPTARAELAKFGAIIDSGQPVSEPHTSLAAVFRGRRFHRHIVPVGDSVALVVRDETDRYAEQQALAESEARFRSASQYSAIGLAVVSIDGNWMSVNPSLCQLLGYTEQELIALNFRDVTHPDDADVDRDRRLDIVSGRIQTYTREKRYLHKSGEIVWGQVTVSLVRDAGNEPLYFIVQIQDVSERRRGEQALRASEAAHRELLSALPVIVYWVSPDPPFAPVYVSPGIERLGYTLAQWMARPDMWLRILHDDDRERVLAGAAAAAAGHHPFEDEYRVVARDGTIRWMHDRGDFLYDSARRPLSRRGVMIDVTERRALQERLAALSEQDDLTGLLNRRGFRRMATQALKIEQRSGRRLALLYFDVDRFKQINDTFGHAEGDAALGVVADGLRRGVRDGDLVARLGGDEFVVLALGIASAGEGRTVGARLSRGATGGAYQLSLTCGVAESIDDFDLDSLLRAADSDLYQQRTDRGA